jgi:hypothetical protein
MKRHLLLSLALVAPLAFSLAQAEESVVAGEKLDSDLGSLPPYAEWHLHAHLKRLVAEETGTASGEKLDSGLGELPPYATWGRHPELKRLAAPTTAGI